MKQVDILPNQHLKSLHQADPSLFKSISHMLANRCTATPPAKLKDLTNVSYKPRMNWQAESAANGHLPIKPTHTD